GIAEGHHAGARGNAISRVDAAGELVRRGAIGEDETCGRGSGATHNKDHRFGLSNPHSPQLPFHRPHAYVEACTAFKPRYGPPPHQDMKISQTEHGGNGVRASVVNQWLR